VTDTVYAGEATEPHRDRIKRVLRNKRRLKAIELADLLDAARTMPPLNRAVRIAAHALKVPVAQINVLTEKTLVPIAVHADEGEDASLWEQTRQAGSSFCKFALWKRATFQVDDARENPVVRFAHATRELDIGSYLAVPIHAPVTDGGELAIIGTICAIDHRPRQWTADDIRTLSDIAHGISDFIAARIRARSEVRGVLRQLDRVLEAAGAGVLATDARGVMTYANPAAARLLGYTPEQLKGRDQHALLHHSRADGSRYLERDCVNYISRKAGKVCRITNDTFWRNDGTTITVDSTMTPIFERGELVGTVVSFVDVTERRGLEESAHAARVAAEVANRAKTELLAGMSTEVEVPLLAIGEGSVRLESLLRGAGTEQQVEEVMSIQRSYQHLVGLVGNLRQFATLEVPVVPSDSRALS
jgi:PAS domain S-box-containing protein